MDAEVEPEHTMNDETSPDAYSATYSATYSITPDRPGDAKLITATDSSPKLADISARCEAIQTAGWFAYVYGSATVRNTATGEEWTLSCSKNLAGK